MKPRTRSALAPTYTVVTVTTAMSLRGYCRTLSARIDCRPAIRITRLTTIARTGRLTNRSVNLITPQRLAIFGLRRTVVRGLHLVVDLDRDAVAELEDPRGHDLVARVDSTQDGNL